MYPLSQDTFVWALGTLCGLHRIPFDPDLTLRRYPPPYDIYALQRAVEAFDFKVSVQSLQLSQLHPAVFPVLGLLKAETLSENSEPPDSNGAEDTGIQNHRLVLVLKTDEHRVLLVGPGDVSPRTLTNAEFEAQATGLVVLASRKQEKVEEENKPPKKFGFRWFIPELLKHKKIWHEILLASFAIQLVALTTPLATQIIIDKVVVHHTTSTLIVVATALGIFLVFNALMGWVRQYLVLHTGNRIDAVLGHKVFMHMMHLPMRYFEHRPTGTLVARLQGVETIRGFLAGSLVTLVLDFPFLFVFLAIMFWYSWQLTLIALATLTVITILSLAVTPLLRKKLNQQFLLGARNQAFLTEYISGMETVKSLQLEPQLEKRYGEYLSTYLVANFESRQLSNTYNTAANALDQLQTLSILCFGAWIVMHNPEFTIGMLVAFQMFSGRLSGPVLRLVGTWQEFQQADIAVKRLGDLMDAPMEPHSVIPSRVSKQGMGITFENVGFRYSEGHPWVYQNLNISIKPNKCTVIMGPSGCGKSTLAKLLLGFLQPQEGVVKLGDRDIRHMTANELRNHFGVVPQETMLFSGTIYENLILANPHAGFEQVIQACQLAGIHEAIESLPQGYQTEIGEHGAGLSGGQKQRLAIARALLKRPSVLIFDEAASNLDQQTAEHFAQTINFLRGKVTVLFITHQLPQGLKVDEVMRLPMKDRSNKVLHEEINNNSRG